MGDATAVGWIVAVGVVCDEGPAVMEGGMLTGAASGLHAEIIDAKNSSKTSRLKNITANVSGISEAGQVVTGSLGQGLI